MFRGKCNLNQSTITFYMFFGSGCCGRRYSVRISAQNKQQLGGLTWTSSFVPTCSINALVQRIIQETSFICTYMLTCFCCVFIAGFCCVSGFCSIWRLMWLDIWLSKSKKAPKPGRQVGHIFWRVILHKFHIYLVSINICKVNCINILYLIFRSFHQLLRIKDINMHNNHADQPKT